MNIFSLITFTCFLIGLYFAYETIKSNPKSLLNQIYFILLLSYCIWCFGFVFIYTAKLTQEVVFWSKLGFTGVAFFSPTFLLFSIIYINQKKELKNYIFLLIIYIPSYIIVYYLLRGRLLAIPEKINDIWIIMPNKKSIGLYIFLLQNLLYPFAGVLIILIFGIKTKNKRLKIQAFIIVISTIFSLIFITTFSTCSIFSKKPYINDFFLLNYNHIIAFITFVSFKYAMSKYRLMQITPLTAFKNILLDIRDFIILFDNNENIIDVNNELIRLIEYKKDEITTDSISILMNNRVTDFKSIIEKAYRYKTFTTEVYLFTKKGNKIPVNIYASMIKDKYDELIGYIIVGHDIIERQELELEKAERLMTESSLIESERKYKLTIDSMNDLIFVIDLNYTIILCNQALNDFFEKLNVHLKTILGSNLFGPLSILSNKLKSDYEKVFNDGIMKIIEERFIINNNVILTEIRIIPVLEKSRITKVITIIRDVTLEKKNEEHFLRISRLESLGVLAGGIAHDFNNMLTGILGNINLAKFKLDKNNSSYSLLTEAERAALKAKDLTYQLLTFSKGGEPLKKPGSIINLIKESCDFVLRGSSINVIYNIEEEIFPVEFDHGQMASVIHNIILNAREEMGKGGEIIITIKNYESLENDLLNIPEGNYVKIIITDNGPGIDKEILPKIFDPYFSTKKNGNGLGLATSFSIIKKHGGYIDVTSTTGKGTSFYIFLPKAKIVINEQVEKNIENINFNYNILFMDDDEMIIKVSKKLLNHLGCKVSFVNNGEEAIIDFEEAKKKNKNYDLIILDLTIKGGMGGKETIEHIIKIDPDVKAIVCSGYSNDPILSEYQKYGFKGVIKKPFDLNDLKREINNIMI